MLIRVSYEIRKATLQDIDPIAEIHSLAIPYSLNAIMGVDRLKILYLLTLQDENSQLLVACENRKIIGFISGTSNFFGLGRSATNSVTSKQIVNLFRRSNVFGICRALLDLILVSSVFKKMGESYYLSTWSMVPGSNPAAGSALFRQILNQARFDGARIIVVNVSKKNHKVLHMYHTLGFLPVTRTVSEVILKKIY